MSPCRGAGGKVYGGGGSQEGSTNEGRAIEAQRDSEIRLRYSQPAYEGKTRVGYGDEFPSAASASLLPLVGFSMEIGTLRMGVHLETRR